MAVSADAKKMLQLEKELNQTQKRLDMVETQLDRATKSAKIAEETALDLTTRMKVLEKAAETTAKQVADHSSYTAQQIAAQLTRTSMVDATIVSIGRRVTDALTLAAENKISIRTMEMRTDKKIDIAQSEIMQKLDFMRRNVDEIIESK